MNPEVWRGALIPLVGTSLGAACVFVMRGRLNRRLQAALTGFAAGVMTAACFWSLLLPALDLAAGMGRWAFIPAMAGFWAGVLFLLALEKLLPRLRLESGRQTPMSPTALLALAVTLHNLPEGMAVGAAYAGWLRGSAGLAAAEALALGIAIQNFPEGAIISMPLCAQGMGRFAAFGCGALSGVIEPLGALATVWFSSLLTPLLPGFLGFAAGAMICVVVAELVPEAAGERPGACALAFALGFTVMMALDAALG